MYAHMTVLDQMSMKVLEIPLLFFCQKSMKLPEIPVVLDQKSMKLANICVAWERNA